jgi:hypothetical protein
LVAGVGVLVPVFAPLLVVDPDVIFEELEELPAL